MKSTDRCRKTRLAECGTFRLELCDCGVVSLIAGFVTIRLEKAAFSELASAIRIGLDALSHSEPTLH
jgi:hypothetical protein